MTMGDVENSNNKIENHRSTLEKIFHILQIILKQIDHIPVILSVKINFILYVKRHLYQQRIIGRD